MWESIAASVLFIDRCLFHVDDEDFCRVKLNRDNNETYHSTSDYINASMVCSVLPVGIERERSHSLFSLIRNKRLKHPNGSSMLRKVSGAIAMEISCWSRSLFWGPTENTLDDFLRMIVEQEIELIIMLSCPYDPVTRTYIVSYTKFLSLIDDLLFACVQQEHAPYFSDKAKSTLETTFFKVNTTVVCSSYRYTGRRLQIQSKVTLLRRSSTISDRGTTYFSWAKLPILVNITIMLSSLTNVSRTIATQWSVWLCVWASRKIELVVRWCIAGKTSTIAAQTGGRVANSSAGVGRTGVLLALYYLIESFGNRAGLNVKQVVNNMRFYRPHLVQNEVWRM